MGKKRFVDLLKNKGYQVKIKKLTGGFVNKVYLVTAIKGDEVFEYVVKKYKSKAEMKEMLQGYNLISALIKTPKIVYKNESNKEVVYYFVKGISLKKLIESGHPETLAAVVKLSKALQDLHAGHKYRPKYDQGTSPDEKKLVKHAKIARNKGLVNKEFIIKLQKQIKEYIPNNKVVIHGDAHLGNFIYTEDGELYIIDTDKVRISDLNSDIGRITGSIEQLEDEGKITSKRSRDIISVLKEVYEGEDSIAVDLFSMRGDLIQSKLGSRKAATRAHRKLILLERGIAVSIFTIFLLILSLYGLGINGLSVLEFSSPNINEVIWPVAVLLIILVIIFIFIHNKNK